MPTRKPKQKPMTLDRLGRMVKLGFENTHRRFAKVDARFDTLAAAAHREFEVIRSEMATAQDVSVLKEDLGILQRDVHEGLSQVTATLKAIHEDVKDLRAVDAELTALRVRVTRLESKRLTNTPVRQAVSVLKCPDDGKNRVVNAQATYTSGSPAIGG